MCNRCFQHCAKHKNLCHRLGQTAIGLTDQHIKILTDSPARAPPVALCPLKKHFAEWGARRKVVVEKRERDDPMFERHTSDKAIVHPKLKIVLFMNYFIHTLLFL